MYVRPKRRKNEYARKEECGRALPAKQSITPCKTFEDAAELADFSISMTEIAQSKDELATSVGSYCTNAIAAKVVVGKDAKGKDITEDVINKTLTYKIVNRTATITIRPTKDVKEFSVPWTYKNVESLSNGHTPYKAATATEPASGAYSKPIDGRFDPILDESLAEADYPNGGAEFDFKDVIGKCSEPTRKVSVKGSAVPGSTLEFDVEVRASVNAQLAEVVINGYKDSFTGETYTLSNEFTYDYTTVEIRMDVDFGKAPTFGTYDLGERTLDYLYEDGNSKPSFTDLNDDPVKKAFKDNEDHFEDVDEFKESLVAWFEHGKPQKTGSMNMVWYDKCAEVWITPFDETGKAEERPLTGPTKGWTFLAPFDGSDSYIRFSPASVQNFGDKFRFETTFRPWYGIKEDDVFTFKATGVLKQPTYALGYYSDKIKNGVVTVEGKNEGNSYDILKDDLNKYFRVGKSVDNEGKVVLGELGVGSENLRVKYEIVTKSDPENGYEYLPVLSEGSKPYELNDLNVDNDGRIYFSDDVPEASLKWEDASGKFYTARDLEVKATGCAHPVIPPSSSRRLCGSVTRS